jgi:heme/copper-type cytochrome/quinol oxidase subunit 3
MNEMSQPTTRPMIDVSKLPSDTFGPRAPIWWGVMLMTVIEGAVIIVLLTTYFYLRKNYDAWPPPRTPLPDLLTGGINMLLMLLSIVPMAVVSRLAKKGAEKWKVMIWLAAGILFGLATMVMRGYEFPATGCQWDQHAYGSAVWTILGVHASHLLASTLENIVLLAYMFRYELDDKHRVDLTLNAFYWYFVVGAGAACFAVIYLAPRLM